MFLISFLECSSKLPMSSIWDLFRSFGSNLFSPFPYSLPEVENRILAVSEIFFRPEGAEGAHTHGGVPPSVRLAGS